MSKLETMRRNLANVRHREFMRNFEEARRESLESELRDAELTARHEEFNLRIGLLTQMAAVDIFGQSAGYIKDQLTLLENEFGIKQNKPKLRAV